MWPFHLSYATLVTYVHVFGAVFFQFPCWIILDRFLAEDEQKPKGLSAHPPNSQTLNQKRMLLLQILSFLYRIFLMSLIWWWLPTEGHPEAAIFVKQRLQKFNITILKTVTWIGFSNNKEFFQNCNVTCTWWIYFYV